MNFLLVTREVLPEVVDSAVGVLTRPGSSGSPSVGSHGWRTLPNARRPQLRTDDHKDLNFDLDDIAREGARRMLAQALEAEVADYIARHQERDEDGRAQVVRNGKARPRKVTLDSGTIQVRAPRADDRRETEDGSRRRFHSQILPPYIRRSPKVAEVLPILYPRGLKRRGMRAPVLAVGDGALGFWKPLRDVWPETREQRCWVHRLANVLDKLPKRLHAKAKAALHEIMRAEKRKAAQEAIARFEADYGAKYPKAVASLRRDEAALLAFFDFPAEHWVHLRTGNVIESPFATVRLRQRVTKGAGSRRKGLLMAFKLLAMAEQRWRRINGAHLIPLVRAEETFIDGARAERKSAA